MILPMRKGGSAGYDLAVLDADATVADYLAALEAALRLLPLTRTRKPAALPAGRGCNGCTACCAERIPLTSVDYRQLARVTSLDLLPQVADVSRAGPSVDIVLKRTPAGRCIFLNPETGLCRVYHARPFVCRTFICCPVSRRADELRGAVTNAGEDELARLWLAGGSVPAGVDPADFRSGAFTGRWGYREIRLRECVPSSLWRRLYQATRGKPPRRGGR